MNNNRLRSILSTGALVLFSACAGSPEIDEKTSETRRTTPPPMKISAINNPEIQELSFERQPDMYEQTISFNFKDEIQAEKAEISIAPLFDNYALAVSARWDDNCEENLEIADLMEKYGIKGAFYVNGTDYFHNMETAGYIGGDYREIARELTENRPHIVGSHALSHPYITYVNRNRMFEEVARNRAQWEAELDQPVNSHALSFTEYRNPVEEDLSQVATARVLERSGVYHSPNNHFNTTMKTDIIESLLLPPDGLGDLAGAIEWALNDQNLRKTLPGLMFSMHSWGWGGKMHELEAMFDKVSQRDDLWFADSNEYGAYRYQFRYTEIISDVQEGKNRIITIRRPELIEVNHTQPLTLVVQSEVGSDISAVSAYAAIVNSERATEEKLFHVSHDSDRKFPEKIGIIRNPHNGDSFSTEDSDFPGLKMLLTKKEEKLVLNMANDTKEDLVSVNVTFRLPLSYTPGIIRLEASSLEAGEETSLELPLELNSDDFRDLAGNAYFLAQVDFVAGEEAGRIYADCTEERGMEDDSFPLGNFMVLGPLHPEYGFISRDFARSVRKGDYSNEQIFSEKWLLDGLTELKWVHTDRETSFYSKPFFDLEVVHLTDNWVANISSPWLLASTLTVEEEKTVNFWCDPETVKHIFINGEEVAFREIALKQGSNDLLIVFENGRQNFGRPSAAAAFFRITDPVTGERVKDITYSAGGVPMREGTWETSLY